MYDIEFSEEAVVELIRLKKSGSPAFRKFETLVPELREHPYTGTGKPEPLRHQPGIWSRRLDNKNRLRYMVNDTTVIVFIVSAAGHYEDK